MTNMQQLRQTAETLAACLKASQQRIVFAESCTGGLIATVLSQVPGVSACLCGSAVVYRNATKHAWLDVSTEDLADESIGPVSSQVGRAMAEGVLLHTPEANIAAAVTGFLGPDSPPGRDGQIFIAVSRRDSTLANASPQTLVKEHRLPTDFEFDNDHTSLRTARQTEAAQRVLSSVLQFVQT